MNNKIRNAILYPNPLKQNTQLTIKTRELIKNGFIEIIDVKGEVVFKKSITNQSDICISNTNSIKKGMHIVKLYNGNITNRFKLIVE